MHVYYRFSDGQQAAPSGQPQKKARPDGFNKRSLLINFLSSATCPVTILADNVTDETFEMLEMLQRQHREQIKIEVKRCFLKSGALSFLFAVDLALNNDTIGDDDAVYLVEDDYAHKPDWQLYLEEGLQLADYATLYDHPDKFVMGPNPQVRRFTNHGSGESTVVFLSPNSHWKLTNSTTMTFAVSKRILRQDRATYQRFCETGYPFDYQMFVELLSTSHGRMLVSSIPGRSCHEDVGNETPLWSR